ncbi:quinone reductase [Zalerion maritima]|uniref:Quinone reductase n=1 Tax=Zalerion maritima TaxID=339359 RepID=A0AAD5RSJ4_9PEZI|nr:quinone reductase [Zalerion maritima]
MAPTTTSQPTNLAAYLNQAKSPFSISPAPYPIPGPAELVIKNKAIAINPVDLAIKQTGILIQSYPKIIGEDLAGIVVAVGSSVTKFGVGDRVLAGAAVTWEKGDEGAFQEYVKVPAAEWIVARMPEGLGFAEACVLPLGLTTAAAAMVGEGKLGVGMPSVEKPTGGSKMKGTLVVWGGSSSVGSGAIQIGVQAGWDVVATASERNFGYCKDLGAKWVFDHSSASVVEDIVAAVEKEGKGVEVKIIDAFSRGDAPIKSAQLAIRLANAYDVHPDIWAEWVPKALEVGTLKCKPDPLIVGKGFEDLEKVFQREILSTSAQKLVVDLS